jgi:hypothetical protein
MYFSRRFSMIPEPVCVGCFSQPKTQPKLLHKVNQNAQLSKKKFKGWYTIFANMATKGISTP